MEVDERLGVFDEIAQKNEEKIAEAIQKQANDQIVIVDLETGRSNNSEAKNFRVKRLKKQIEDDEFTIPGNVTRQETIQKKMEEFNQKKIRRIMNLASELDEGDAMNPFHARICILGMKQGGEAEQYNELQVTEKEMVELFARKTFAKTVVTYNGNSFDIVLLKQKAMKYGITIGYKEHIDLMERFGAIWKPIGGKELISLDVLAVELGIEPNKYQDVNPAGIGTIFDIAASNMASDESAELIEKYMEYNEEDLRVTEEIAQKAIKAGLFYANKYY